MSSPPQSSVVFALAALGMLELSVENHDAAAGWLSAAAAQSLAMIWEPGMVPLLPDAAEASIALERFEEAEPLDELLEANARRLRSAVVRAVTARLPCAHAPSRGDLAAPRPPRRQRPSRQPLPRKYDRARMLLSAGRHQRRRNQRRAARKPGEAAGCSRSSVRRRGRRGFRRERAARDAVRPIRSIDSRRQSQVAVRAAIEHEGPRGGRGVVHQRQDRCDQPVGAYRKVRHPLERPSWGGCLADGRLQDVT